MPDDELDDPFKTENRSWPNGKAHDDEVFRESDGRKSSEDRRREFERDRPPDKDDD